MATKTVWLTAILSGDGESWGPNQAVTVEGDEAARLVALGVAVEMETIITPKPPATTSTASVTIEAVQPRSGRKKVARA